MKLKLALSIFIFYQIFTAPAQEVPKKVVVEHFTNTLCGTCASRNPGFYTNYNAENTGNMVHLTIHPSSPYSSCIFNQHDKSANDDRTHYYSIYGSTPRLVINGSVISTSTSFNNASLFAPYIGQTTPVSLTMSQQKFGTDSIRVKVVVKTEASHSLGMQKLYVVLAENTVFYTAPNGENEHHDVMRKPLFGNTGIQVTVPSAVGDSLVFVQTVSTRSEWDVSRMFSLAILQDETTKSVTQTEALLASDNSNVVLGVTPLMADVEVKFFPNPTVQYLNVMTRESTPSKLVLRSIEGKQVLRTAFTNQLELDVSYLPSGIYFATVENEFGVHTQKVIKADF